MIKRISNISWARTLVSLFYIKGVRHACISPGSRNTPLTYALLEHSGITCFSYTDERSSCFFGLGISKRTKQPVVILTTSGTATANLFPGVIEAELSMVPLIIVTADRPKRLINTGATQTINQKKIYGKHVRTSIDIKSTIVCSNKFLKKLSKIFDQSLGLEKPPGPVHFNVRFDEPLLDKDDKPILLPKNTSYPLIKSEKIKLEKFKRPLIICGPLDKDLDTKKIIQLSKKINAPIFADSLSNMRHFSSMMIYYENYIEKVKNPDLILRFGNKPTSKKLNLLLDNFKDNVYLINIWDRHNDDCKNIYKIEYKNLLKNITTNSAGTKKWLNYIKHLEYLSKQVIDENIDKKNSQAKIIHKVVQNLKKDDCIFVGNSTVIRTFDQFSGKFPASINVYGNYISRGIDGITSSALGMAYANKKNNILITGDVSFFYDLNALHILEHNKINLSIVIINNKGGQIFSRLPYSKESIKDFKKYWITPSNKKIKDVAQLFKLKYYTFTADDINQKIKRVINSSGVKIIEVTVNEKTDIMFNENIEKKILNKLS